MHRSKRLKVSNGIESLSEECDPQSDQQISTQRPVKGRAVLENVLYSPRGSQSHLWTGAEPMATQTRKAD